MLLPARQNPPGNALPGSSPNLKFPGHRGKRSADGSNLLGALRIRVGPPTFHTSHAQGGPQPLERDVGPGRFHLKEKGFVAILGALLQIVQVVDSEMSLGIRPVWADREFDESEPNDSRDGTVA